MACSIVFVSAAWAELPAHRRPQIATERIRLFIKSHFSISVGQQQTPQPHRLSSSSVPGSAAPSGGSSLSFSRIGLEIRCSSLNHLPRSTILQRCEQNGPYGPEN